MSGPCSSRRRWTRSTAAGVAITRATVDMARLPETRGLEEAERLRRVADEQVLRLLVVLQHHLVVLAADARLLVPAERGVGRVEVVAVRPHAAGLDAAAHAVGGVAVARPHAGAEAVERVVGDGQRFRLVLERG